MIIIQRAAASLHSSYNFRSWQLSTPLASHLFCKHQSQMAFNSGLIAFIFDY